MISISLISVFTISCISMCYLYLSNLHLYLSNLYHLYLHHLFSFTSSIIILSVSTYTLVSATLFYHLFHLYLSYSSIYLFLYQLHIFLTQLSRIQLVFQSPRARYPLVSFHQLYSVQSWIHLSRLWVSSQVGASSHSKGQVVLEHPLLPVLTRNMDLWAPQGHRVFPGCSLAC